MLSTPYLDSAGIILNCHNPEVCHDVQSQGCSRVEQRPLKRRESSPGGNSPSTYSSVCVCNSVHIVRSSRPLNICLITAYMGQQCKGKPNSQGRLDSVSCEIWLICYIRRHFFFYKCYYCDCFLIDFIIMIKDQFESFCK